MHRKPNLRRRLVSRPFVAMAAMAAVLALAAPASAQAEPGTDTHVVLTGRVEVRTGERVENVVILDGPAVIDGQVDGAVIALNGDIRVSGTVQEDVVAVNGRATVVSGARVGGDVVSSSAPQVDPGATVEGETRTVRFSFRALGVLFWLAWWVAVTVSLLLLGIALLALFPAAMTAAYAVAHDQPGPSVGWGVLIAVGLPVVSVLAMLTVLGIPLGVVGLLSLALLYAMGYVVASLALGRTMVKEPRSRYLAFLVGLVVLRLVGLVPVLGGLVTFLASAYGLGALAIAGRRAARRPAPVGVGAGAP